MLKKNQSIQKFCYTKYILFDKTFLEKEVICFSRNLICTSSLFPLEYHQYTFILCHLIMKRKHLFVTVGTTKFEKLIAAISEENTLTTLENLGYTSVQFQTGTGIHTEISHPSIDIIYNKYFADFNKEINQCDLVISHAGAGTCLEVLKSKKPLIVVINEDLMDNHQTELAKQLSEEGYVYYCTCNTLKDTLEKDLSLLKTYPVANINIFSNYLDECMGF